MRSVFGICGEGLDCFRRWKLQKRMKVVARGLPSKVFTFPLRDRYLPPCLCTMSCTEAAYAGTHPSSVTLMSAITYTVIAFISSSRLNPLGLTLLFCVSQLVVHLDAKRARGAHTDRESPAERHRPLTPAVAGAAIPSAARGCTRRQLHPPAAAGNSCRRHTAPGDGLVCRLQTSSTQRGKGRKTQGCEAKTRHGGK